MAERLSAKIHRYCEANGITIPVGFGRHPASRYVVIELSNQPKLVARTWFNQSDVIYYIKHLADNNALRILDFKEYEELSFENGTSLKRVGKFEAS